MMYLMVASPFLLPLEHSAVATLEIWLNVSDDRISGMFGLYEPQQGKRRSIRRCGYSSSSTPPASHGRRCTRRGWPEEEIELLSFVWLLLGHFGFFSSGANIELVLKQSPLSFYVLFTGFSIR
jgi:hypothetical protein